MDHGIGCHLAHQSSLNLSYIHCALLFLPMDLPLKIKTTYTLEFETTGQKWMVPDDCVKEVDDQTWVKLSATKYGFIKLLLGEKVSGVKNPSLSNCQPWKDLVDQRNQKSHLVPASSALFDDETQEVAKNKRKRKATPVPDGNQIVELDLGVDCGKLTARKASKTNEDLMILLDAEQFYILCKYLHSSDLDLAASSSRSYKRTGKFAKKEGKEEE